MVVIVDRYYAADKICIRSPHCDGRVGGMESGFGMKNGLGLEVSYFEGTLAGGAKSGVKLIKA